MIQPRLEVLRSMESKEMLLALRKFVEQVSPEPAPQEQRSAGKSPWSAAPVQERRKVADGDRAPSAKQAERQPTATRRQAPGTWSSKLGIGRLTAFRAPSG
eukprot:GHVS01033935.1.p2 GENE.GHVS01033935.1~~GHVS01033935.1.p2  ORF type:complete len:101 (+),score=4.25 GHVS01033935.1:399-701(+)